ncbi:hypothetical protein FCV25MIE_12956 [Fagus crenata]
MSGKGMVEASSSKSYKDVVTDRKQPEIKQLQAGKLPAATVEKVSSAGPGNGGSGGKVDQTKKGLKEKIGEKWVPRVRPNAEAISSEIGPIELVTSGSEPSKLGLVGSPNTCLGIEARASYEELLGFGYNSTFEVGSSSGANNAPGPHVYLDELEGDGYDPQGLGYQDKGGSTGLSQAARSNESLGSDDTMMVHRSTAAPRLDWVSGDGIFLVSRWGHFDVSIKGFGARLLGMPSDGPWIEIGGAMGLKDGADCGAWEDDGEDLGFDEGESCGGERSLVIGGWRSDWDGSVPQREED